MKKLLVIPILFLQFLPIVTAQNEEEIVKKIREQFTVINSNLKNYKLDKKDVYSESTEGGEMHGYFENDKLVLLHCEFYGEMGNVKEDYYFKDGELFFVFTIGSSYSSHIMDVNSKIISFEENRYYFNNKQMIRWLNKNKKPINKTSIEFRETDQKIFKESARLIELFNNN